MVVMPRQERRAGVLETPLGTDKLAIVRFDGSEGINELFEFRLEALSADGDIDFDQLIGKHATLTINSVNGRKRKFDGIVTETQWLGVRDHFHAYRLVLRPWLWILSQRTDNYIFHDMSVTDIIADVFSDYGALAEFDDRTSATYPPIEYCVQYRESDMDFVCRLMEEFGISYSFVHADSAHKLVMSDANTQLDTVEGASRRYIPLSGQDRRVEECIHQLVPGRRFASGKATWKDYNFKKPTTEMLAEKEGTAAYEHAGKELYDWPGRYTELGLGQTFAQIRLEAQEAQDKRCMAAGNSPSLWAGSLVTLEDHPVEAYNIEYLVLRSQHTFISQSYRSGQGSAGEDSYEGQYELLDSAIPLRPLMLTPCPLVNGPQTAFVVGKQGEEIDCDEYGRILVRFHWDRESDQSMRCRVAQNWAYKNWGGMIIPRIGMEVMVEFLEGDPDQPLVTGSVYNGDNMPPYTLPKFKTRSSFRSNSHKAGGFNEIRFEDEGGEEEVFIHAQKYLNIVVGDNETHATGMNRHISVGVSQSETIGANKTATVGSNQTETIGGDLDFNVGGHRTTAIGKSDHLSVGEGQVTVITGVSDTSVSGDQRVQVGGGHSLDVGTSSLIKAGMSVVIEATSITLKSGGNFVNINPAGVQIQGTMVLINSGGAPGIGMPVPKSTLRSVKKVPGPFAIKYPRSSEK
jgi:type VI secretion system secreted protein VgrG